MSEYAFSSPVESQFLSATLARPEGDVHVSLYVAKETFNHFPETSERTLVLLDIVETAPMEKNGHRERRCHGQEHHGPGLHRPLYGIYFDTGKADLKPESRPTLDEIAKLLQADQGLRLYVVGHTDSVGGFDYDMDLSRRRAQAVAQEFAGAYGVSRDRLRSAGVGFLAPVATNENEEGRALNRRVELVKGPDKDGARGARDSGAEGNRGRRGPDPSRRSPDQGRRPAMVAAAERASSRLRSPLAAEAADMSANEPARYGAGVIRTRWEPLRIHRAPPSQKASSPRFGWTRRSAEASWLSWRARSCLAMTSAAEP